MLKERDGVCYLSLMVERLCVCLSICLPYYMVVVAFLFLKTNKQTFLLFLSNTNQTLSHSIVVLVIPVDGSNQQSSQKHYTME